MAAFHKYHSPYANLAAAIIRSGQMANDTRFLESDWCDTLRELCRLDDEMHPDGNHLHLQSNGEVIRAKGLKHE